MVNLGFQLLYALNNALDNEELITYQIAYILCIAILLHMCPGLFSVYSFANVNFKEKEQATQKNQAIYGFFFTQFILITDNNQHHSNFTNTFLRNESVCKV